MYSNFPPVILVEISFLGSWKPKIFDDRRFEKNQKKLDCVELLKNERIKELAKKYGFTVISLEENQSLTDKIINEYSKKERRSN